MILWQQVNKAIRPIFLTAILIIQAGAAAVAIFYDYRYPFSGVKEIAEFIKLKQLDGHVIAGNPDYATSPLSAYLNKPVYFPCSKKSAYFITWNKERFSASFEVYLKELQDKKDTTTLLVLNYPIDTIIYPAVKIKESADVIVYDEKLFLYFLKVK